jgi:galactitol-specific phosphotransferase system IIC component
MDEGLPSAVEEIVEDIEQLLAAQADGVVDLAPATVAWLVEALDALSSSVRSFQRAR